MKNIAVVAGGYSGEYEISIKSGIMVMSRLDRTLYKPYLILITREKWVWIDENRQETQVDKNDFSVTDSGQKIKFDAVFVAVHGTPGEDGKLQGYFDMLGIPYTTSNHSVSALTFNKAFCNKVVEGTNVNVAKSIYLTRKDKPDYRKIISEITLPCFVKPCNSGSSVGTSKVKLPEELESAIQKAFESDDEVMVEEFINGSELTCGVFRYRDQLVVFPITEVVSKKEFFDFEAKYNPSLAAEITPAQITEELELMVKGTSSFLYNKLNCKGVVRFDFIVTRSRKLFFLEVNTVPGLTAESIVPKQAQVLGYGESDLFNMMVEDALSQKK